MTTATNNGLDTQKVDVSGLETAFRRGGSGQPLLYLTGQGYTGRWLPLYESLAQGFDVIVPDHPGFGGTGLPDFINDFNDLAVHYAEFLDVIGTGPVHVVGHGFGGWLAAEFAGVYPERVLSLTLIAPSGLRPDESEPMVDWYRMRPDQVLDLTLGEDRDEWAEFVAPDPDYATATVADYQERMGVARVAWNPRYSFRLEHRLQRVKAPAQIIVPDQDDLIAPSIARRYTEFLPGASLSKVSGDDAPTRHLLVVQEPGKIAELIVKLAGV
ncbi:MAG TPA: alpha/beta hydrolase [Baekduia sp.]|nr:alpha/beta hydrolase [Baekduia sp.]